MSDVFREDKVLDLQERDDVYYTLENFANREYNIIHTNEQIGVDLIWNYYTYDGESSIFMKTIGKWKE